MVKPAKGFHHMCRWWGEGGDWAKHGGGVVFKWSVGSVLAGVSLSAFAYRLSPRLLYMYVSCGSNEGCVVLS
jgi:hypothetical protein